MGEEISYVKKYVLQFVFLFGTDRAEKSTIFFLPSVNPIVQVNQQSTLLTQFNVISISTLLSHFFPLQIKQEIARCQEMKRDKIQQVIENTRHELVDWWDRCYVDEAEREKFMPFTDGMSECTTNLCYLLISFNDGHCLWLNQHAIL